ncbi:iron chelate uptake ABC transporter family permease subunit [Klebsiella pneumoniae]|nr:iron chelate uptake ABC transporter family permease subunit [Klebsiella pneumoniae]
MCGVVLQSLLKNALAEPYVLGASPAGASTGAVSIVVLGLGAGAILLGRGRPGLLPLSAFVALLTNGAAAMSVRFPAGVAARSYLTPSRPIPSAPASAQQARDDVLAAGQLQAASAGPEFQLVIVVVLAGLAARLQAWRGTRSHPATMPPPRWGLQAARAPDPLHHCGS